MTGRRAAISISVLCALALSAFTAASAVAVQTGYTTFTCANVGVPNGTRTDSHCLTEGPNQGFTHKKFTENTEETTTNANTASGTTAAAPSILKGTAAGTKTGIECSTVMGNGTIENKIEGEEMYTHSVGKLTYTGCKVIEPAGKGCKVKAEKVETKELTSTTQGQGMDVKITPKEGTEFASITIESCSVAGLNNTFPVSGSVKVKELEAKGATASTTEADVTTQGTLTFAGQKSGLEGSVTIKGKKSTEEDAKTTPLVVTTPPYNE